MILQGHVLDVLRGLRSESVQLGVSSPPYWMLRKYEIPDVAWGGDPACDHTWGPELGRLTERARPDHSGNIFLETRGEQEGSAAYAIDASLGTYCVKCGAWYGQLGLEPTPELYVAHIVEVFREFRRVLRHDGVLYLNMGDCYVKGKPREVERHLDEMELEASPRDARFHGKKWSNRKSFRRDRRPREDDPHGPVVSGLKPKDLVGIPWMVAFALRGDGWYLRQDNVWFKKNPMPESAYDRTTRAHEYVFHLTKSEDYFYDRVATFEQSSPNSHHRGKGSNPKAQAMAAGDHRGQRPKQNDHYSSRITDLVPVRNQRSVWPIATQAFKGAHYATFPEKLVEPCIKAGTSSHGACSFCGAPWRRVVARAPRGNWNPSPGSNSGTRVNAQKADRKGAKWSGAPAAAPRPDAASSNLIVNTAAARAAGAEHDVAFGYVRTIRWDRTCKCELFGGVTPCVVMDPFSGAGTVGLVAERLGREYIGIELGKHYIDLSRSRGVE